MRRVALLLVLALAPGGCKTRPDAPDARPPSNGKLRITSDPSGAAVIEDGERIGRTPLTLERLAMSRPALELVKEGYRTERVRRLVEEGRTVRVHVPMRPEVGTLIVRSGIVRGATILVDGVERGDTPRKIDVSAGRPHVIEVRRFGFKPFSAKVTVSAGETRDLDAVIVPEGTRQGPSGWLTVRSDLPATVRIDDSPFGNTPLERAPLPARRYRITLSNPTLKVQKTLEVRIPRGKTREINVKLRP